MVAGRERTLYTLWRQRSSTTAGSGTTAGPATTAAPVTSGPTRLRRRPSHHRQRGLELVRHLLWPFVLDPTVLLPDLRNLSSASSSSPLRSRHAHRPGGWHCKRTTFHVRKPADFVTELLAGLRIGHLAFGGHRVEERYGQLQRFQAQRSRSPSVLCVRTLEWVVHVAGRDDGTRA